MHVTLVTHNVIRGDGQGRVNFEIVRHGLREGYQFTIVSDRLGDELKDPGVKWVPVHPNVRRPNLAKVAAFAHSADRAIAQHAPRSGRKIVVGNGFVLNGRTDVNISHFVHSAWYKSVAHTSRLTWPPYSWYQLAYTRANRRWEQQAFRQAERVVAVSEAVSSQLTDCAGVPRGKIDVIPNGVDIEEFCPGRVDRGVFGLPPSGQPLAMFVGGIRTPLKNLDGVLRALPNVPDLHVAVAGDDRKSPFPKLASQLGVRNRVHFLGFRKDIASLLRSADLLVHPSRYDPFALVVLEAMASGKPVITAKTVGASSLVGKSGVVIEDPDDVEALAAAMRYVTSNRSRRKEMGQAGRSIAEQHSWQQMTQRYLSMFQEVCP